MKWLNNRFLLVAYILLMVLMVLVGCTSKEDPSEVLTLCGNHSCGDLAMVTTDTSSDGFHYLNPTMSPDGQRILFTADWKAIPAIDHYNEDELYTIFRQLIVIPTRSSVDPATSLAGQDGVLLRFDGDYASVTIGGNIISLTTIEAERRKACPTWIDDTNIAYSLDTPRGYRIFTSDVTNYESSLLRTYAAYMEPADAAIGGGMFQHMSPSVSPDGRYMVFTRSGCALPDSFETCTGLSLLVLDMETVGLNNGYDAVVHTVTNEYSRIEAPRWSPDGTRLAFSGGMDVGNSTGLGTEIFTIDFDAAAFQADELVLDDNLQRLTYTTLISGDPIAGVFNTTPTFTADGSEIIFVSTRRAPSITLHDRNLWKIPSDGRLDPEIFFFTRADDVDPEVQPDGSVLLSSQLGFTTEILDQLEEEAYQALVQENTDGEMTEVEMRSIANAQRGMLEFFEGVMSHLYIFRP